MMVHKTLLTEGGKLLNINLTEMIYIYLCRSYYRNTFYLQQIRFEVPTGAI